MKQFSLPLTEDESYWLPTILTLAANVSAEMAKHEADPGMRETRKHVTSLARTLARKARRIRR